MPFEVYFCQPRLVAAAAWTDTRFTPPAGRSKALEQFQVTLEVTLACLKKAVDQSYNHVIALVHNCILGLVCPRSVAQRKKKKLIAQLAVLTLYNAVLACDVETVGPLPRWVTRIVCHVSWRYFAIWANKWTICIGLLRYDRFAAARACAVSLYLF